MNIFEPFLRGTRYITTSADITEIKSEKNSFDRAETESAIYTAVDDTIRLASPVVCWRNGEKIPFSASDITIKLKHQPTAP